MEPKEKTAEEFADSIERRGTSYWEGLRKGYERGTQETAQLREALKELIEGSEAFKQAFIIAVGDRSPFAKVALNKINEPIENARKLIQP